MCTVIGSEKAYNKVSREKLQEILSEEGMPIQLTGANQILYPNFKIKVKESKIELSGCINTSA
jgi:hypothetical protein